MLRKFGSKVFYGDATRMDLIDAAGAKERGFSSMRLTTWRQPRLTDLVREHFPNLKIVARARNVTHYVELKRRGVDICGAREL